MALVGFVNFERWCVNWWDGFVNLGKGEVVWLRDSEACLQYSLPWLFAHKKESTK